MAVQRKVPTTKAGGVEVKGKPGAVTKALDAIEKVVEATEKLGDLVDMLGKNVEKMRGEVDDLTRRMDARFPEPRNCPSCKKVIRKANAATCQYCNKPLNAKRSSGGIQA